MIKMSKAFLRLGALVSTDPEDGSFTNTESQVVGWMFVVLGIHGAETASMSLNANG